jgi:hypothetical protein
MVLQGAQAQHTKARRASLTLPTLSKPRVGTRQRCVAAKSFDAELGVRWTCKERGSM